MVAMQASEYDRLYQVETKHWWFRSLHNFIRIFIPENDNETTPLRALDIGCGTGGLLAVLRDCGYNTTGADYARRALTYSRRRQHNNLIQVDANNLPFIGVFDLLTCIDVLEVAIADPQKLADNAIRSLKPGGIGIFVVAAHQWLISNHDRAVNSVRRYNLPQLRALFSDSSVEIMTNSYLFFLFFPFMALHKLFNPIQKGFNKELPSSDLFLPPIWLNQIFYSVGWLEAMLLRRFKFPIGTSALLVVRKR